MTGAILNVRGQSAENQNRVLLEKQQQEQQDIISSVQKVLNKKYKEHFSHFGGSHLWPVFSVLRTPRPPPLCLLCARLQWCLVSFLQFPLQWMLMLFGGTFQKLGRKVRRMEERAAGEAPWAGLASCTCEPCQHYRPPWLPRALF